MKAKEQYAKLLEEKELEIQRVREELKCEIQRRDKEIEKLTSLNQQMNVDIIDLKNNDVRTKAVLRRELTKTMSSTFTGTQIDRLIENKKRCRWTEEDITRAVTLKSMGNKSHQYLRKHLNFPLPADSTIFDWVKNINCEPGMQRSALRVMKYKSKDMPLNDRVCALIFDEMKLTEEYCFDKKADRVYNPHSMVQVALAVGLIGSSWRQPIYYNYDSNVDQDILTTLISALEEAGFPVHAVCCDFGSTNQGLMKDISIGWKGKNTKPYFTNPCDPSRNIHWFGDPPHMMKLARNNLLDHPIRTPDGVISKKPLEEMLAYEKGVFKKSHKISAKNLTVAGPERQNVQLAVQLLSNSVGLTLAQLGEENKLTSDHWKALSDFILLMDKWWDIMNVSNPNDKFKPPYKNEDAQNDILNEVIKLMQNSRVQYWSLDKNKMPKLLERSNPFQKGIIISSLSLMNLFKELKEKYGIRYLLTRRLNQDPLEHTFGILRAINGLYDHPNSLGFKYRMKMLITGKRFALTSSRPNTTCSEPCTKLTDKGTNTIKLFEKFSSPINKCVSFNSESEATISGQEGNSQTIDEQPSESPILTGNVINELEQGNCDEEIEDIEGHDQVLEKELDEDVQFEVPECERDGFEYALGWMASKFEHLADNSESVSNSWISRKSRGGLKTMKAEFVIQFEKLEGIFRKVHGDKIREGKNAINDLLVEAKKVDGIEAVIKSEKIIKFYLTTRMHFQIRYLNKQYKSCKGKKLKKFAKIVK